MSANPHHDGSDRNALLLLELRNLIADKEWATACANMETAHRDGWTCDWYEDVRVAESRIRELLTTLGGENP